MLAAMLAFCGMCGSLARMGLTALTSFQGQLGGALIWSNFAGSLIMGFTSNNSYLYGDVLEGEKRNPKYKAAGTIPIYIALNTGLCGSITSFSSFVEQLFLLSANKRLSLPYNYHNSGYGVMMFLGYVIETMSVSVTGFLIGKVLAKMCEGKKRFPLAKWETTIEAVMAALGVIGWIVALVLFIVRDEHSWRYYTGAMIFSPFGVYARHLCSRYLNKMSKRFMIGTFTANISATVILSVLLLLQTGKGPHSDKPIVSSKSSCLVISGVIQGFCGCFSTISSFVNELVNVLSPTDALRYGSSSIVIGYALMVLIYGTYIWVHGDSGPVC